MFRAPRLLITLLLLVAALPLSRAATLLGGGRSHVQASLVAADASVQPGHDLFVALRLVHDEHWHTYWINPGTGIATTVSWQLPPGWKAHEIEWPAPTVLRDHTGTIIGQGYDGDLLLPIRLTPPSDLKPGTTVKLAGAVDWLMCADVCVPGNADVSLSLPVSAEAPTPDPTWGVKIREVLAGMPKSLPDWTVAAVRDAKTLTLTVRPTSQSGHVPKDLWFFSRDGVTAYEHPQNATSDGRGGFTLKLPLAVDAPKDVKRLVGVLTSENGWRADGTLRGLQVDTELSNAVGPATTAGNAKPASSLPGTLLLAFIGGLILNLMPCVFPVLGIKIIGFVNQAGHDRGRVVAHGLVFALGVLLSFWTLAAVLAILRAGGDQLGWGFQLQSAAFVYALAVLILVFAMNMSGVFEFGLRATAVGSDLQMKSGYAGSFFSGVLATIVATPCSAPFLAPALGAALAVSTATSFAIFTAIAVGLALPYLLLSIFPQAVKMLPRPGAWMETFKQVMAFPLYATTAYLAWVLAAQTSDEGFRSVLFSFVLIAMAVWIYGRWHAPGSSAKSARASTIGLVALAAAGLWVGWPQAVVASNSATVAQGGVTWEPWSPEAVEKLRNEGRIVYVDFTARWCATCQANKRLVFHDDAVLRYFAEHKVATLRGDWTNRDPRITAELAKYGRSAVPFNQIWLPGRPDPLLLPELLTGSIVLNAMSAPGS